MQTHPSTTDSSGSITPIRIDPNAAIFLSGANVQLSDEIISVFTGDQPGRVGWCSSTDSISAAWHHIAVFHDGTTYEIYVDGVRKDNCTNGTNVGILSPTSVKIGNLSVGPTTSIDDVRVYNRALSADEIKRLYIIGAAGKLGVAANNDFLAKGLVGYWNFDGKTIAGTRVFDASGTGNYGTMTNGPKLVYGKIGQGLSFDGVDDRVQITRLIGSPANVTVSAWFNCIRPDLASGQILGIGDYVGLRCDDSGLGATAFYYKGSSQWNGTSSGVNYAGTGWHHIAYTIDDTNDIQKLYIDGVVKASNNYTESIVYSGVGTNTFIGTRGNGNTVHDFKGLIDDVRVYSRALSPDEIKRLYNMGK